MPTAFNPKIWWLEVGLNDLGRSQCSEEVVVLGVLRVVEEVLSRKPDATVVINSLFPLADLRGGLRPGDTDFNDSFNSALRTRPTSKMHGATRPNGINRNRIVDAGQTDNGDSALIRGPTPKKSRDGNGRSLAESVSHGNRQLLFGWGKKTEPKDVKMVDNKTTQKMYNPITHHERKLPLWTSVSAINTQLRKFANKNDKVIFFDATDIFTDREGGNTYMLKTDMISIRGHPTRKGYEKWEQEVIARAKTILDENKQ